MLAIYALNLAATLPVMAKTDLQANQAVDSSNFERPNNAKIDNSAFKEAPTPEVNIDNTLVQLKKQEPIKFQPFELKDPETGKEVSEDTILTLPNGEKIQAAEYYAEINRLEQQFNELGYSLRSPEKEVTLQESNINQSTLEKQAAEIDQAHQPEDSAKAALRESLEPNKVLDFIKQRLNQETELAPSKTNNNELQKSLSKQIKSDAINKGLRFPFPRTKTILKTFNLDTGDPKIIAAYIKGKMELTASPLSSSAYAEANAGGYMFNNHADLLRATASLNAPASGNLTTNMNLFVHGNNVYNFQDARQASLQLGDKYSRSLDKEVANFGFSLGPVSMKGKLGVQGSGGFTYNLVASPKSAYAKVNAFLDTRGYGQAVASIKVVSAGLDVDLTFLKDNLDISALALVDIEPGTNRAYLKADYYAFNDIKALNGKIYGYVKVFGKQLKTKIWDWNGFNKSGYLFNGSEKIYF